MERNLPLINEPRSKLPAQTFWDQTNMLQIREVHLVHLRDANAETCVRVSRRACISCVYLIRDFMIISLYDRKKVRNSYAQHHACRNTDRAINIQFFDRIGLRVLPRTEIAAVPSLYRDKQYRYHQNSLPGARACTIEHRKRRKN